jgi:Resolvase, N terminal domain
MDAGISCAKGRDKRPGFDSMLKDATRRRFDVLMFWSIDRLGRSTAAVTTALAELDAAGVGVYADKEAIDATTPLSRAMLQMAAVFAELERGMIRERVTAGLARVRAEGKRREGSRDTRPPYCWRWNVEGGEGPWSGGQHRAEGEGGDASCECGVTAAGDCQCRDPRGPSSISVQSSGSDNKSARPGRLTPNNCAWAPSDATYGSWEKESRAVAPRLKQTPST